MVKRRLRGNDYKQLEFSHWIGTEGGQNNQKKIYFLDISLLRESFLLPYTPFQRLPCPPPHGEILIYGIIMAVQRNYCFTYWVINMKLVTEALSGIEKMKEKFCFVLERKVQDKILLCIYGVLFIWESLHTQQA